MVAIRQPPRDFALLTAVLSPLRTTRPSQYALVPSRRTMPCGSSPSFGAFAPPSSRQMSKLSRLSARTPSRQIGPVAADGVLELALARLPCGGAAVWLLPTACMVLEVLALRLGAVVVARLEARLDQHLDELVDGHLAVGRQRDPGLGRSASSGFEERQVARSRRPQIRRRCPRSSPRPRRAQPAGGARRRSSARSACALRRHCAPRPTRCCAVHPIVDHRVGDRPLAERGALGVGLLRPRRLAAARLVESRARASPGRTPIGSTTPSFPPAAVGASWLCRRSVPYRPSFSGSAGALRRPARRSGRGACVALLCVPCRPVDARLARGVVWRFL